MQMKRMRSSVRLMSTKQNCKSFRIAVRKSNGQNTRLVDRMTEILLTFKKPHKEENKLPPNSKIQKTDHDPLVSLRSGPRPSTSPNVPVKSKLKHPPPEGIPPGI